MQNERQKVANFRAWEIEMTGRALRARLLAKIDTLRDAWKFYREMYGKNDFCGPPPM